jgi:hypothetical protein
MAAPAVATTAPPVGPERHLAALARAAGPLRRVIVALAGRLVAVRGWERLGYARPGDYTRERLGLSARSLQEFARVERRLAALPQLEAALISGRLPWSKVRLLARFVAPADEARWIERARGTRVRALEREVRAVDRGALEAGALARDEEGGDLEPCERLRIRGPAALCFKWNRTREYASRVAGERIAPGTLLEMITAETLSALPLEAAAQSADAHRAEASWSAASDAQTEAPRSESPRGAAGVPARQRAGASAHATDASTRPTGATARAAADDSADPDPAEVGIPVFLRSLLDDVDAADAFELDARLRRAVRLEQRLDAQIAPLLRRVAASEYEWRVRFRTLGTYAREHLGMSPRKARALLRLERVGDVCPELRAAYREGRVSWVQAQILAPLFLLGVEGEWRGTWLRFAQRVSVRGLEGAVDRALLLREANSVAFARHLLHPERQMCARLTEPAGSTEAGRRSAHDQWSLTVTAPRDVARLFRSVLCTLRRALEPGWGRLPSEGEALDRMLDHALHSWGVDDVWLAARIRRQYRVFDRDGWRCTVPGCTARRNLHAHHIVFRSAGGGDEPENQTTLCAYHHQRGVHAGLVRLTGRAPDSLWFELGIRSCRPPLVRYGPGDRLAEATA